MYTQFHGTGSETWPDKVIREKYFPDYGHVGTYLDVGAAGPISMSNSYHFRCNGWKILSIEANPDFCKAYRDIGFNVVECAVGATSCTSSDFSILMSDLPPEAASSLGGVNKDWAKEWSNYGGVGVIVRAQKKIIQVKVMTLNEIMREFFHDVTSIDILDLDVERGEMNALLGFDISKYAPKLCLIEDHDPLTSGIEKHMVDHGYKIDLRIGHDNYYLKRE